MGKNVIIFGADIDNKNKSILILRQGPTQGIGNSTLTAEAKLFINFTQPKTQFVLSLHCNGNNSSLFANATKMYQFKAKISETKDYAMCLGNIWNDFTINNMKKNRIKTKCKIFSVQFNPIDTNDILDIHK